MIKLFLWWVVALLVKRMVLNSVLSFLMLLKRVFVMLYLEFSFFNRNIINIGRFLFFRIF